MGEWLGGYLANSLAVMSDAAHLLSDFGSFLLSIFAIWLSMQRPTQKMTFGYFRAGRWDVIALDWESQLKLVLVGARVSGPSKSFTELIPFLVLPGLPKRLLIGS